MGLIGFIFEIGVLGCLIGGIASNAAVVGKERRLSQNLHLGAA
jgi:hypothetical protein